MFTSLSKNIGTVLKTKPRPPHVWKVSGSNPDMGYLVEGFRRLPHSLKISVLYLKLNHDRIMFGRFRVQDMGYLVEGFRCLPHSLKISVLYLKLNHDRCLSHLSNSLFTNYCINRHRDIRNVGWTIRGLIAGRDEKFFSFAKHPDRLWDPPGLLFKGWLFPGGNAAGT